MIHLHNMNLILKVFCGMNKDSHQPSQPLHFGHLRLTTSGASSRSSAAPQPSQFAVEWPIKRNLLNNHYKVNIHVSCSSCSNPKIDVWHRQTTAVSTRICRQMFRKSTCQSRQSWGERGPAYARHLLHTGGWASEFIHMAVCRMVHPIFACILLLLSVQVSYSILRSLSCCHDQSWQSAAHLSLEENLGEYDARITALERGLFLLHQDDVGRKDYASRLNGGTIVMNLTTLTNSKNHPLAILDQDVHDGRCWTINGSSGQLSVHFQ